MGNRACCDDRVVGGDFAEKEKQKVMSGQLLEGREGAIETSLHERKNKSKHEENGENTISKKEVKSQVSQLEHIQLPILSPEVNNALKTKNFFNMNFDFSPLRKRLNGDIYSGQLDEYGFPHGLGQLYKVNGSFYIGQFEHGKAQGKGAIILSDGSYYYGDLLANEATGEGQYWSKELQYVGGFKQNLFHGQGKEKGVNYSFRGDYERNNKKEGLYLWKVGQEEYEYFGPFAANRFEGKGTLRGPKGTYRGYFIKGEKHGQGIYQYLNGLRYEGEYKYGVRSGHGALYDSRNVLAYEGEFQKGLPHGDGIITDNEGRRIEGKWVEGIDEDLL